MSSLPTPTAVGNAELHLQFMSASQRTEAILLWRKLEVELCNRRLTCSAIWVETWLNHFGGLIPHQFAIGWRHEKVCAIALLTQGVSQYSGPFVLKTWHLGTAGEPELDSICVEYNSLLASPEDGLEFGDAIWKWARDKTACDEFRMDGFDSNSIAPLLARNPQASVDRKRVYFFDLRPSRVSGDEPLMRLGTQTRANIRRTLRELGDVRSEWAETAARAEQMFHQMVSLHQARWTSAGKPGAYASTRFHDFHLELLNRAVPTGLMTIVGLTSGTQFIGGNHILIDNHRGLLYQSGWTPGTGRVSPGMALDYHCICECLRRGYDEVDFLAGDGEHKRRLATDESELAWVVWRRANLKNTLIRVFRRIKTHFLAPRPTVQPIEAR